MKGSVAQIKFANDLIEKINKEIEEIKTDSQLIKYFSLEHEIETNFDNSELKTEECQNFIERRKVKINKQFDEVINTVEEKIQQIKSKEYAGDIISELNKKIFDDYFNHSIYIIIYNGIARLRKYNKNQKSVLVGYRKTASNEF